MCVCVVRPVIIEIFTLFALFTLCEKLSVVLIELSTHLGQCRFITRMPILLGLTSSTVQPSLFNHHIVSFFSHQQAPQFIIPSSHSQAPQSSYSIITPSHSSPINKASSIITSSHSFATNKLRSLFLQVIHKLHSRPVQSSHRLILLPPTRHLQSSHRLILLSLTNHLQSSHHLILLPPTSYLQL